MTFGEICVRENSVPPGQIVDFFTKTAAKRLATREKLSLTFSKGIFLVFLKLFALKKVTKQFRMSKWFDWKFLELLRSASNF